MLNRYSALGAKGMLVALLGVVSQSANAGSDNPGSEMFTLGGFGTLGVVHSTESEADFSTSYLKPNGAGYTRSWSASVDSLVGAQISASFSPQLSAVLQIISEQNYNNTYWPHVEWADVKYQITPDFSVRAGRTVLQSFMLSDSRKVGYANPWVRPPAEVYSLIPVTNSDGVDASYRLHTGNVDQTFAATYGSTSPQIPKLGSATAKRNWLLADKIEYGSASLRIAYQQSHVSIQYLEPLFDAFAQFGPQGDAIAAKYDPENAFFTSLAIGAAYDPGQWFLMGEWGTVDFHSVLGKKNAWYASGGYRIAKFTPYMTYAAEKADNLSDPGLNVATLPPYLAGPAMSLNTALNAILGSKPVQHTVSVGARWDFMKSADLKLQFDRMNLGAQSRGNLINSQPGFALGSSLDLFSATVDFVF